MSYKEEILNEIEYKNLYNDFFSIKSKNISKGKDKDGNLIFISPSSKYILYHSKYKELYDYFNELIEQKLELIDKITLVKNLFINDTDNKEYKQEYINLIKEYENINALIEDTYNSIEEYQITDNEKNNIDNKIKEINLDLKKILKEREFLINEKNDENEEKINEYNNEIISIFNKIKKYNINKQKLSSNNYTPRVIKIRNAYVRYYDNLDKSLIKLEIN
jgi:hypothetical protein